MRLLLPAATVTALLLTGVSQVARGQGSLKLFSDPAFTQCTLSDTAPGVANVYVAFTGFSLASRFRVASGPGFTGVWLADSSPYTNYGSSSQVDANLYYGTCEVGTFLVLTLTYQLLGTSTCSELSIAPSVGQPVAICYDCFDPGVCGSKPLHVNCAGPFDCNPVAVEPSTWGSVKALYRN